MSLFEKLEGTILNKHPELLAEQLRIMDELCALEPVERHHAISLERVRDRKRTLRERNNQIC